MTLENMAQDFMIAGPHGIIYDLYYKQADPGGTGECHAATVRQTMLRNNIAN
jgi:hypothetical protein